MCVSTAVCVFSLFFLVFLGMFLLTQLHGGACLVDRVLTGAQAVLQLGGRGRGRGGRADGADGVGRVYQRGGRTGRGGARGARRRRVGDFTPDWTAPASSSDWTGQTGAPRRADSKWSPAEEIEKAVSLRV